MTDVFISYKREDEARVGRLVQALQKAGLSVWWDRGLPGGESWRGNLQSALDAAKCVIVAWTQESTGPAGDFVRDEAGQAKSRGVLVPVILEPGTRPPLGFGELQAIDLAHWRGSASDPFFRDLVAAVQAKLEGRPVPPARGPMARLARRLTYGGLASAATAGLFGFAMNFMDVQNNVCAIPLAQPLLSDACGGLGLGERPTREQRIAWASIPAGSCEALRAYVERFPDSVYRDDAADMISARRVWVEQSWTPAEQPIALYVGRDAPPSRSTAEARAAAMTRAATQAERRCRDFAASGLHRFTSAVAEPQEWLCDTVSGGAVCGFDGRAVCRLEERRDIEREACGAEAAP
jgi:hypothetical protein